MMSDQVEEFVYLVVGGGIAGVSCIEQILQIQPNANILLISPSPAVKEVTSVTRLTKTLDDFLVVEKSLTSFAEVHQSVQVIQDEVIALDTDRHVVDTKSGRKFKYQKLCLCCGAKPNVLFETNKHVVGIRDTQSVEELSKKLQNVRRITILGNGGIATELVYELKGVDIKWVVKDDTISTHYLDAGAAEFFMHAKIRSGESSEAPEAKIRKSTRYELHSRYTSDDPTDATSYSGSALGPDWHNGILLRGIATAKDIDIIYNAECVGVYDRDDLSGNLSSCKAEEHASNWPVYVKLSNGSLIGCDLIISATGVHPNTFWIPIQIGDALGIPVNHRMETKVSDVFAAGDVCQASWKLSPYWFQMRLWTQARQMGLMAGKYMTKSLENDASMDAYDATDDEPEFFFEIFSHVTRFFGFKVVLLGLYNAQGLDPGSYSALIRCTKHVEYIKLITKDGKIKGALLIGETGLEETMENLIANQLDVGAFGHHLLDPEIDIEDYFD